MSAHTPWHELVSWRRGILGTIHAQWPEEEVPGASACSEDAGLSGPALPYQPGVCMRCVRLALSLGVNDEATVSADPTPRPVQRVAPFDWRAAKEESARRVALMREESARTGRPLTAGEAAALWGTTKPAAHMALRKLRQRGAVVRVGLGLFRVVTN